MMSFASWVSSYMMIYQDRKYSNSLLQAKNPYELMGYEGEAHRSVVLSVANQSYLLPLDKSFNLRGRGCYVSPSFLDESLIKQEHLDTNLKETTD